MLNAVYCLMDVSVRCIFELQRLEVFSGIPFFFLHYTMNTIKQLCREAISPRAVDEALVLSLNAPCLTRVHACVCVCVSSSWSS